MPTLDEYRRSVLVRLEGCQGAAEAKTVLAEADLWLIATRISEEGAAAFWQAVSRDLELSMHETTLMRAKTLETLLRAILDEPHGDAPIRPRMRARRHVRSVRGRRA